MKRWSLSSLIRLWMTAIIAVILTSFIAAGADDVNDILVTTQLENNKVRESSGVAVSYRHENVLWTHNDSGHKERIYAFQHDGTHRAEIEIKGVDNEDWEALASYVLGEKPQLLIGDVGDNALRRKNVTLYRINEPKLSNRKIKVDQTFTVRYPDGPQNCEAIAVDRDASLVLLASKVLKTPANIYSVPLDFKDDAVTVTAKFLGSIDIPMITGMDIHPQDGRIIFVTYGDAFLFRPILNSENKMDWPATFQQQPEQISLPFRRQGEAVCFSHDVEAIWLTSEKHPATLHRIALPHSKEP